MKSSPHLPQLEKACVQQRTPNAAKKKKKRYHRLSGLNYIHFSQFWRLGSPRSRHWHIRCRWGPSSWSPSCCVLTWWGEKALVSLSSYKGTNPSMGALLSWPHLNLVTTQWSHLQTPSHWGLGFQHEFGVDTNIQLLVLRLLDWAWEKSRVANTSALIFLTLSHSTSECFSNHFYTCF